MTSSLVSAILPLWKATGTKTLSRRIRRLVRDDEMVEGDGETGYLVARVDAKSDKGEKAEAMQGGMAQKVRSTPQTT